MIDTPPVSAALEDLGILHTVFRHPGSLKSLEQAAEERGQRPEQVVRSILFRESQDSYVMVLTAGPSQLNWKKLRRYLGISRVTMASREEVLEVTGYELGAVAPFGLPKPIRVIVDHSVIDEEDVSMGSGVRGVAIMLKSADMLKALGKVEIGEFGK
jgi:Cys-tRNA(Pro) deacylase